MKRTMRRMAIACVAALACAAVMALGVGEAAAGYDEDTTGVFEFKLGPYHPGVDREFDNGPYEQYFGDQGMLYGELGVDFHLWREFGALSLGVAAGYTRISAPMIDDDGNEVETDDTSTLRNMPVKTSVVYRYDYSAHNHNIPLVPVAKLGLNYNFWRVTDAGGDTMVADDRRAVGGMAGWHATLGLNLHLDFFDPTGAASLDMIWGVKNSFLFAEYTFHRAGAFRDGGLDLSSNHWAVGVAFEF